MKRVRDRKWRGGKITAKAGPPQRKRICIPPHTHACPRPNPLRHVHTYSNYSVHLYSNYIHTYSIPTLYHIDNRLDCMPTHTCNPSCWPLLHHPPHLWTGSAVLGHLWLVLLILRHLYWWSRSEYCKSRSAWVTPSSESTIGHACVRNGSNHGQTTLQSRSNDETKHTNPLPPILTWTHMPSTPHAPCTHAACSQHGHRMHIANKPHAHRTHTARTTRAQRMNPQTD